MVVAGWLFARSRGASLLELADIVCLSATPGLMLGPNRKLHKRRELFGRPTSMPWGIVFPEGGDVPRHPSQLYESFFEGAVLFTTLWLLRTRLRRNGQLLSCFLILYGVMRFTIEFFREPDPQIGYLFGWLTMGQLLVRGHDPDRSGSPPGDEQSERRMKRLIDRTEPEMGLAKRVVPFVQSYSRAGSWAP